MHVAKFLGAAREDEKELSRALLILADRYEHEPEVRDGCKLLASWSKSHIEVLKPLIERYGQESSADPNRLMSALFQGNRVGGPGMIRDLQDASALATHVRLNWTALYQAAPGLQDKELKEVADHCGLEVDRAIAWLCTVFKNAAPQALVVPAEKESELAASLIKPPRPT